MSQEFEMLAIDAPIVIGATGLEDIKQCMRMIVRTCCFSVPMDRGFAHTGSFIDAPLPHAVAAKLAELTEALESREPRIRVTSIRFAPQTPDATDAMDGRTWPVIRWRLREGVEI